jgi:hypothetical protein
MVIRKIGPLSLAKIVGTVYAALGLLIGAVISLIALLGAGFAPANRFNGVFATVFGLGAIIFCPLFYGAIGFVTSLIGAWIYNMAAGAVGGIQLDIQ